MNTSVERSAGKFETIDAQLCEGPWPLKEYDAYTKQ